MHVLYWLRNVISEIGVNVPRACTRVAQGPQSGNWRRRSIVGKDSRGTRWWKMAGAVLRA
jgi:hypothetical protein